MTIQELEQLEVLLVKLATDFAGSGRQNDATDVRRLITKVIRTITRLQIQNSQTESLPESKIESVD